MKNKFLKLLTISLLVCATFFTLSACKEDVKSTLIFNTLEVIDTNIYGKVSNDTKTFSFLQEIKIQGDANFILDKSINCQTPILSKTVELDVGDNVFYILETIDGKDTKLYTVTIHRNDIYKVTFNSNGGPTVESQTVEEGFLATKPSDIEKAGYTFDGWDFDFNTPVTQNETVNAKWIANTNTPYKVEYYLQNIDDYNYTLEDTENLTGTTDTIANAEIKTFPHFTYNQYKSNSSGNINGDGSTVLKVYYTRNYYQVTVQKENDNGGTVTGGGNYKYGKTISVKASINLGYTFDGWYNNDDKVSDNLEYTFNPVKDITLTAKFSLKTEMQPFSFVSTSTTCVITGLKDKTAINIIIPDYITRIGSSAFRNCDSLQSITIPDSVTSISSQAFQCCSRLQSVTIGNGVTSIDFFAFEDCTSLQSITIGNNVTSIGSFAFENCRSLQSITIPDSVTSIGSSAFFVCSSLQSVTIGNGVTSIGGSAFYDCGRLTKVNYTGTIDQWVEIHFDGDLSNPLYYAKNLYINDVLVTDVVLTTAIKINDSAFEGCTSLQSVTIGNNVTSIGNDAFWGTSLQSIVIPDSVTSIGNYAFASCLSLQSIVIPDSITFIDYNAFA